MASKCKRYYWLKLKQDFFADPRIKKLRRIAGGDTYTVILLKLMLLTIKSDGVLVYEGIENTLALELALKMDEDDKNVEATLIYMQSMNLLQELDPQTYDIPQVRELTGSETDAAERKRRQRKREKEAKRVTLSHQSHTKVTSGHKIVLTETEKELKLENIDTDTEIERDVLFQKWLDEYSLNAKNPPAYKAIMRKKITGGNKDAIETFLEWKQSYLENQEKKELERKIKEFDYSSICGNKLNGVFITSVITQPESSYIDLILKDGSTQTFPKEEVYGWIHQKKKGKK